MYIPTILAQEVSVQSCDCIEGGKTEECTHDESAVETKTMCHLEQYTCIHVIDAHFVLSALCWMKL